MLNINKGEDYAMFFKVHSFTVVLLFLVACSAPEITEYQDSYTVKPTAGSTGSISFSFAGKAVGVDNYAVYYSETPLDDPLTASPSSRTLNTYAVDAGLALEINGLREGHLYYVWVYPKRGAEIIDPLPMQTVYPYTTVRGYQLVSRDGDGEAKWLIVNGAKTYSVFKEGATSNSLLAADVAEESFFLGTRLNDQDSSYVVAYDSDGDVLAKSDPAVYDITISLSMSIDAGVFPHTVELRWTEDIGATSYDIIYSEVDHADKIIPGTEKIENIDPFVDGIVGLDPLDKDARTVSYLMKNLTGTRYAYQVKGKKSDDDGQFTGLIIAQANQDLPLTPFSTIDSTISYEMKLGWNREYGEVRDLNGDLLNDLYSDLKYKLTFTRPSDAPTLGGSEVVYPDTSDELSYTQNTYSVAYNDSANIRVYQRDSFSGLTVGDYTARLELVGQNKTTGTDTILGSYTNTVVPNPVQTYALGSQFDGVNTVTLDVATTSTLKHYYRMQENWGYDDIPLLSDLELLPVTGELDLTSPSLASLAGKSIVQYELWTTSNDVYVNLGTGSIATEVKRNLTVRAVPGRLPGSLYVSWNASYTRETNGYDLEIRQTGETNWTSVATDIAYTAHDYSIYDLDLIDETHGNVSKNYDLRLIPKTKNSDQSVIHSVFPKENIILQTPSQLYNMSRTHLKIKVNDQYISATGAFAIKDIANRDGTKFNDHFTGDLAPQARLVITRPDIRPAGVAKTFENEFAFTNGETVRDINDADNASYVVMSAGRAYTGNYSVKYQLIGKNEDGEEQILGESEPLSGIRGGFLNPAFIGSKSGSDNLTLSSDTDAKRKPRKFTKQAANSANYQLIYFTTASGHSAIPTQPDSGTIRSSKQIYKLGDGFPDFAEDLRRHEGVGGVYYIQVYTYRSSDDLLIGSKLIEFNSSFVLQPMFWWISGFRYGIQPFVNWFMPYLRDQDTGDTYYFDDSYALTPASSGYGHFPLRWLALFKIEAGFTNTSGATVYVEQFIVPDSAEPFNAMVRFYRVYHAKQAALDAYPYTYFFDPGTGTRFGKGVGDARVYGHFINRDSTNPAGYGWNYDLHPGP